MSLATRGRDVPRGSTQHAAAPAPKVLASPEEPFEVASRFIAARWMRDNAETLRWWRGGWRAWDGTAWRELENGEMRTQAYEFTKDATYLDKKGELHDWSPTRYKVSDLLDALRARCHLESRVRSPAWIDAPGRFPAQELVSVGNGLLHVPTRSLLPHDPRLFNTMSVPFSYDSTAPAPVRWTAFLNQLWDDQPDAIAALQEFFGYVISGATDLHKILLVIGPTRAGKGVITRVMESLLGPENCVGPTLASLAANFGLQPLIGKALAVIADARLGYGNTSPVVERLLSVSGEDVLTIDRKYQDPWTGPLPTRFVVVSNELPRFGDASGAIASRFVALTLRRSFLGRENTRLTEELRTELPSILNWALDGLERLQARGRFTEPRSSNDAIVALQDLASPVAAFVRDRCERHGEVGCEALYAEWKRWADENGHRPGSAQNFGRDLRAAVPGMRVVRPRDDAHRQRRYAGISFASTRNGAGRGPSGPEAVEERGPHGPKDFGPFATVVGNPDLWERDRLAELDPSNPDHGLLVAAVRSAAAKARKEIVQ